MGTEFKIKYFETSAKSNIGLTEMFEEIIETTYARKFNLQKTADPSDGGKGFNQVPVAGERRTT